VTLCSLQQTRHMAADMLACEFSMGSDRLLCGSRRRSAYSAAPMRPRWRRTCGTATGSASATARRGGINAFLEMHTLNWSICEWTVTGLLHWNLAGVFGQTLPLLSISPNEPIKHLLRTHACRAMTHVAYLAAGAA